MSETQDERSCSAAREKNSTGLTQAGSGQDPSTDSGQTLRKRAEERAGVTGVEDLEALSPEAARHLVHELRVHQIELEMQNDELRRTQEALEGLREHYFDLYDLAPVGYFTLSEQGLILEANLKVAILLETSRGALVKERLTRFILPEDQDIYYLHRKKLFRTGEAQVFEFRMLKRDQTPFWVRIEANAARHNENGEPVCRATMTDITDRKRAEKERLYLEHQLRHVKKAESLARMAGAIAHHFNNKLMVIMGNLELTFLCDPGPSQELATFLQEAKRATAQASEVSSLMLAYLGQTTGRTEILDLAAVCREAVASQSSVIPGWMSLKTSIPPDGPTIKANRAQVELVLTNLLTNAREAIGERQGNILVAVRELPASDTVSPHLFPADWKPQSDAYACLEVSDTGCGVDPDKLDLIFDPFFSTKFAGRGLGLAVVLGVVRAHRGAVTVESELDRGSTFRVYWPLETRKLQPVLKGEPDASGPIEGLELVLVVDDEPQLRKITEFMLGRLGCKVIAAGDGLEAVGIFREHKDEIRLVLLDLTMPGLDGWQTLAALRELRSDIPVILASGYDEAQVMRGMHSELPQAFLHKPYQMKELKAALEKVGKASLGLQNGAQTARESS